MEELGLDWSKLASVTTDGAPSMVGASRGLVGRIKREMEERGLTPPLQVHCLIHQQAQCCKVLKWESVMKVVVSCINFIRANGLKHRQFQAFRSELESAHGDVLYHAEVRWLSRGRVYYASFPNETFPNIRKHAMKMSTVFGSTYICEQTFSRMKLKKNQTRSRLSDQHLHQSLRLAVTGMEPDINLLTSQKQAHSSH